MTAASGQNVTDLSQVTEMKPVSPSFGKFSTGLFTETVDKSYTVNPNFLIDRYAAAALATRYHEGLARKFRELA